VPRSRIEKSRNGSAGAVKR